MRHGGQEGRQVRDGPKIFLDWLGEYVTREAIRDKAVRRAMRKSRWPLRTPDPRRGPSKSPTLSRAGEQVGRKAGPAGARAARGQSYRPHQPARYSPSGLTAGHTMRVLVAGWFSFEDGHATAGDLLACELVCDWLEEAGYSFDVALAPPFASGWTAPASTPPIIPAVAFVCGPFSRGPLEASFLGRFADSTVIGLNLTMIEPVGSWNPFDALLERDSTRAEPSRIVFLSRRPRVPLVGVCRVEPYDGAKVAEANAAIRHLITGREMAAVDIDTRLDENLQASAAPARSNRS